jgi:hypothetical protein
LYRTTLKALESSTGGGGGEAPTPPIASSIATAVAAVVSAVKTVPASFWLYALSGTCMYRRVLYTGSHTTASAW